MEEQQQGGRQAIISTQCRNLTLDEETVSSHLFWLLKAHGLEDGGCNISKDAIFLLETPALGCVRHNEGDFVGGVGGLWLAVFKFHFLGIAKWCQRQLEIHVWLAELTRDRR